MAGTNNKSAFMSRLALANEAMLDHLPLPSIAEVFYGAPRTLRESLEVLCREMPEEKLCGDVNAALDHLTILCAAIEHHLIMARIQAPPKR